MRKMFRMRWSWGKTLEMTKAMGEEGREAKGAESRRLAEACDKLDKGSGACQTTGVDVEQRRRSREGGAGAGEAAGKSRESREK